MKTQRERDLERMAEIRRLDEARELARTVKATEGNAKILQAAVDSKKAVQQTDMVRDRNRRAKAASERRRAVRA